MCKIPDNVPDPPDKEPCVVPIDGTLDLHMFNPSDVKEVLLEYIDACQGAGILELRIIHGKGIGTIRQQVHSILKNHERVQSYSIAPGDAGGWGATLARLRN